MLLIQNAWLPHIGLRDCLIEQGRFTKIEKRIPVIDNTETLDAEKKALVPGLVNGHTHAAMTLFRGFGDDMPLMQWLKTRIWPAEAKLTEEDVYWGTKLACLEMIRSGTVTFQDMYWHFHGMAQAVEEMGLRAGVGAVMVDVAGEEQAKKCKKEAEEQFQSLKKYSPRISFTLTPHAIYTVSESSLRWVAEFADAHDLLVHIHLSETEFEVNECLKNHQLRPAFYLDKLGLLREKSLLAHGVHLNDDELDLIAEKGSILVTNPVSNQKLAVGGVFPYPKAKARHIPMALGTDGAASNNGLDLFQELKAFALIQKHENNDPTTLPAQEAWDIATGAKAPQLTNAGRIAVGAEADCLILDRHALEIWPEHDFISNIVYAATGHVVDSTIVDGKVLMKNRQIDGIEQILEEAARRAWRVCDDKKEV
ncbi:amidohydrolase family protein [Magnetococcales bacterium HHB-1]